MGVLLKELHPLFLDKQLGIRVGAFFLFPPERTIFLVAPRWKIRAGLCQSLGSLFLGENGRKSVHKKLPVASAAVQYDYDYVIILLLLLNAEC